MKKIILYSVLSIGCILMISTASAQKGLYLGTRFGPQTSIQVNSDEPEFDDVEYTPLEGAFLGISAGYNFSKNFGVGTELLYSYEGQRMSVYGYEFVQRLHYMKIPLLVTFNSNPKRRAMFTAKLGPQLGVLLDARYTDMKGWDLERNQYKFADLSAGGVAGAGVSIHIAKGLYMDAGLRADCAFTTSESKRMHTLIKDYRVSTVNMNASIDFGIKYVFN